MTDVGTELTEVPFGEMIASLAVGIADAQLSLDKSSIEIAKIMGDAKSNPVQLPFFKLDSNNNVVEAPETTSMLGAGFQPTFYQFTDTIIELKMAISMQNTKETSGQQGLLQKFKSFVKAAPVDARYSNKYSYHVEGSSSIKTKIAPVPPSPVMQKVIELKAEAMRLSMEAKLQRMESSLEEIK